MNQAHAPRPATAVDVIRGIALLCNYSIRGEDIPLDPPLIVVLIGSSDPLGMANVVKRTLVLRYPGWRGEEYDHLIADLPERAYWSIRWPRGMEFPLFVGGKLVRTHSARSRRNLG